MNYIKVDGLDGLLSNLNKLSQSKAIKKGLTDACLRVEESAKNKCPIDTGDLQTSITHSVEDNIGVVGSNKEYAPYVEFGTGLYAVNGNGRKTPWAYEDPKTGETIWTAGQHPQPFLHPALEENAEAIQKDIINAIRDEIKEVFQ